MQGNDSDPLLSTLSHRMTDVQTFDEALDVLSDATMDMGFDSVLYGYIPVAPRLPNGDWLPLRLNLRNFPASFERGWEKFMKVDPYYRACFETTLPFDWHSVRRSRNITTDQKQAIGYLADFGLRNGVTVPVHLPHGKFAVMSAITCRESKVGRGSAISQQTNNALLGLMHSFTKAIHDRKLETQIPTSVPSFLTAREQECLKWASQGKTSAEIAVIIDRSVDTVRLHIKNAIRKLDASNRSHAIAIALHLGLI